MARQERHQLHVDISWQMPPRRNSSATCFQLEINGTDTCFVFNVSDSGVTEDSVSPRFHFTSESLFEFSKSYRITLYSLPKSKNRTSAVVKESRMPIDPELNYVDDQKNISQYCKTHTRAASTDLLKIEANLTPPVAELPQIPRHPNGQRLFGEYFLQSITRTILVEFVGAPPHYCFEEY
ncbi:hypothetical protein OSTOST_19939, partial [Ostertagia ostertagi]